MLVVMTVELRVPVALFCAVSVAVVVLSVIVSNPSFVFSVLAVVSLMSILFTLDPFSCALTGHTVQLDNTIDSARHTHSSNKTPICFIKKAHSFGCAQGTNNNEKECILKRRGKKPTIIATARMILASIYHMLFKGEV